MCYDVISVFPVILIFYSYTYLGIEYDKDQEALQDMQNKLSQVKRLEDLEKIREEGYYFDNYSFNIN